MIQLKLQPFLIRIIRCRHGFAFLIIEPRISLTNRLHNLKIAEDAVEMNGACNKDERQEKCARYFVMQS
jgi:hypothetical protein